MSPQVEIRHQAALAGVVTNGATSAPIAGATVRISSAPVEFTSWLSLRALQYGADWNSMTSRPDLTVSAPDGWFHFLDLPDGSYTVSVWLPRAGSRYGTAQASATVARDAQGNITPATFSVAIPQTSVSGVVTGSGTPVPMAQVRVQGSGEHTRSDMRGKYVLAGLEVGSRSIQALAQGFAPLVQTVKAGPAGTAQSLDFALKPAT
jgi:hypothetical protein